jgi:predicted AAA+ superfamily ATPase
MNNIFSRSAGFTGKEKNIHIITGPRQVGKTTVAHQIATKWPARSIYTLADSPLPWKPKWIYARWERPVPIRLK